MKNLLLILILETVIFTGCTKKNDDSPAPVVMKYVTFKVASDSLIDFISWGGFAEGNVGGAIGGKKTYSITYHQAQIDNPKQHLYLICKNGKANINGQIIIDNIIVANVTKMDSLQINYDW